MAKRTQQRGRQRRRSISGVEVIAVVAIAFAVVAGIIVMANRGSGSPASIAPTPTAVQAAGPTPVRLVEVGTTPEGHPFKGSAQAKVTIVEYSDYT